VQNSPENTEDFPRIPKYFGYRIAKMAILFGSLVQWSLVHWCLSLDYLPIEDCFVPRNDAVVKVLLF
jgi:hypothetical protein